MWKKLNCAALLLLPAFADQLQNRPPVLELTLKQAIEIALAPEGSTRVQLAEEALKQAHTREAQSRAALLPDFEGYLTEQNEVSNLRAVGLTFPSIAALGFQVPSIVGPFDVFDVRAQVNQTVFDLSTIRRYQASKVLVEAAKQDNEGTRDQVTDQVARAYLAGLRAEAALETAKANVELSEALLKLARSQKTAGTGTGIEVTRAEVQLANDQQRLLVAGNDVERSHLQLLKVLGLRLENPLHLADTLSYLPVDSVELKPALETAFRTRAELKAQQRKEEGAKLSYSATKMERVPSLGAFANYGTIGPSINDAFPTRTYGVTLRVPVFDGGRRDARRAESASEYRQERIRTTDLRDQIELDVRVALDSLRSADAQVKAAEDGLKLSENELAQAQRRYKAGVTNSIEVTDAQTRLDRARQNRIDALYNHNLARIDLNTAMGTIQKMIQ
jgi:outer membrane protein TolC